MCGIFGVTGFKQNQLEDARSALHTLEHRGPDQWNDFFDSKIYLGHRRLSILDLSENGKQPMVSANGSVRIIVNGEIYNYLSLKKELEKEFSFKSTSDSEVILHGYQKWGVEKLLEKIDGMYAFAIYDSSLSKLHLVRDRAGIKPLFYSHINNEVVFASELKALQKYLPAGQLSVDYTAAYDFLTHKYIPAPKTLYKNVFKLEPGNRLTVDLSSGNILNTKYWKLTVGNNGDSIETAVPKIRELVTSSVNEQMMSDVPVGFFLSGGVDSSSVVAAAASVKEKLNTFSIGFTDKSHDETHFADIVANRFKTNHKKRILDEKKTEELFQNLKKWYDEPYADFSCFPTYLVSKFAKEKATVVLTGDGGDEVFGGYNWYNQFIQKSRIRFPTFSKVSGQLPNFYNKQNLFAKILRKLEYPYTLTDLELYTKLMSGLIRKEKEEYRLKWGIPSDYDDYWYFRKYYKKDLDIFTRLQYLDFHTYLPDDILTKVDRVSMAVSLECRVPLLSQKIVEYAFALPPETRLYNSELKGAMKLAFEDCLPSEIINRSKKGFSIPRHSWKNNIIGEYPNEKEFVLREIFDIK